MWITVVTLITGTNKRVQNGLLATQSVAKMHLIMYIVRTETNISKVRWIMTLITKMLLQKGTYVLKF